MKRARCIECRLSGPCSACHERIDNGAHIYGEPAAIYGSRCCPACAPLRAAKAGAALKVTDLESEQ